MIQFFKYEIESAQRVWYWALVSLVNAIVLTSIPAGFEWLQAHTGDWMTKEKYPTTHLSSMIDVVPSATLLAVSSILYALAILIFGERAKVILKRPAAFVVDSFVLFLSFFLGVSCVLSIYFRSLDNIINFISVFGIVFLGYAFIRLVLSEFPEPTTWTRRLVTAAILIGFGLYIPLKLA